MPARRPPHRGLRRALACLTALVGVAWLGACRDPEPTAVPPVRVFFLGLDGASWKVIGPMLERNELPAFARLVEEGAYQPHFGTIGTTLSPLVWTSAATGRLPADHGIQGFKEQLASGAVIPPTSNSRKVPALWNVATRYGRSVGVIGWWASWPAEAVNGYVVTDHANPASSGWMVQDETYWTADPDLLRQLGRDTYPPELAAVAASHWLDLAHFPYRELRERGQFTSAQAERLEAAPWFERERYSWVKTFFAVDYPYVTLTRELVRERPTDLTLLYLRAVDPAQHAAWDLVEPEKYPVPPEHLDRDRGLVESVYRYVDTFLADVLDLVDERTILIVASDHGSEVSRRVLEGKPGRPGEHYAETPGVLFVHGPHVRPGTRLEPSNPLDLMPTMAWLLGLPVAKDLPGRILGEAFEDDFRAQVPTLHVRSYGTRETTPGEISPADAGMIDQLRALGYIE